MALVNRSFSVNVTPGMMPPIVHVSEYDVGRAYTVSILDEQGNTFTIPSGTTASIEGTLNGSVGFTQSATVSNNQVSFTLSQSMTAYSGKAWCKIKLTQNSQPIQTCAFVLAVDRAGVEAGTVIGAPGFEEQIADAAAEWMEQQGFTSPTVSVTPITGGNRVTFTDAEHPQGQSIDVMDGEDTGVEVDTTLSVAGKAADSKAVGDAISALPTTAQVKAVSDTLSEIVYVKTPSEGESEVGTYQYDWTDTETYVYNRVWGADSNGKAAIVAGTTTGMSGDQYSMAVPKLYAVNPGDTLTFTMWGQYVGDSTFLVCGYDNNLNLVTRMYGSDIPQQGNNGPRVGTVPANVFKIGIMFHLPDSNKRATYSSSASFKIESNSGEYVDYETGTQMTDYMVGLIDKHLYGSYEKADYFQKGYTPKAFSKHIGIVCAGQSNAMGRNASADMPSYINLNSMTNVHVLKAATGSFGAATNIPYSGQWAFDLVTYYYLSQIAGEEIYVMKHALGGTPIDPAQSSSGYWTADYEQLDDISKSLLLAFESVIRHGVEIAGNEFDIRAMLWHQGEGDSFSAVIAKRYYLNLRRVIEYCRGVVGNKRMPFIFGTIPKSSAQFNDDIDNAIRKIAHEDPYVWLVDLKNAALQDQYHFNATWSEYFGKKAYDCLIDAGVISATKLNPSEPS